MLISRNQDTGNIRWRIEPDRTLVWVRVSGELDIAHADELRGVVAELRESGWLHIGIDFRGLSFIDASGLHVLLEESARARACGGTLIVEPGERCERLLSICGIADLNVPLNSSAPRPIAARSRNPAAPPVTGVSQQCPECSLILRARFNYLALDYCPRCLARAHRAIELRDSPARSQSSSSQHKRNGTSPAGSTQQRTPAPPSESAVPVPARRHKPRPAQAATPNRQ